MYFKPCKMLWKYLKLFHELIYFRYHDFFCLYVFYWFFKLCQSVRLTFFFSFLGNDKLNWEATKKLYKEFLTVFDKIILPTHGSCHCQFIMFYICSFKSDLSDGFIDYLWKKVQNPMIGPVFRQLSSFYIGSFLARAKYINIRYVWCINYIYWFCFVLFFLRFFRHIMK